MADSVRRLHVVPRSPATEPPRPSAARRIASWCTTSPLGAALAAGLAVGMVQSTRSWWRERKLHREIDRLRRERDDE